MARVTITVEREGGSTIEIAEQSAMPLFTDEQCALLAQEAYVRTLRALGVRERPEPDPPAAAPATAEDVQAAAASVTDAIERVNRPAERKAA